FRHHLPHGALEGGRVPAGHVAVHQPDEIQVEFLGQVLVNTTGGVAGLPSDQRGETTHQFGKGIPVAPLGTTHQLGDAARLGGLQVHPPPGSGCAGLVSRRAPGPVPQGKDAPVPRSAAPPARPTGPAGRRPPLRGNRHWRRGRPGQATWDPLPWSRAWSRRSARSLSLLTFCWEVPSKAPASASVDPPHTTRKTTCCCRGVSRLTAKARPGTVG